MRLPHWMRSARVLIGLSIILVVALAAVFAPLLAPHDPNDQNLIATLLPPAWLPGGDPEFLLGTDSLGRDV
ncbi:MAG: ABC transporter permease, partial [Xanthobacteraceae bacterium]|nr:ABC transporter permease [Xanthobacteraceae bacterium]